MKKLSFLALAAAGLMLGACSSEKDDVANTGQPTPTPDVEGGSYIGINIAMPSSAENSTRANEDYSDGDNAEWAVKNATLYVFKGDNEADATFQAYYSLGTDYTKDVNSTEPDNVTATYSNATLIGNDLAKDIADNKSVSTVHYYAYVILNHNGQVTAPTKNSTKFSEFTKQQFTSIGADIAAEANIHDGGLLMTNAPVCAAKGGSEAAPTAADKYTTLVELDKTKVYGSPAEALGHPAACIYVERAAVKITVSKASSLSSPTLNSKAVTFDGWQIINYEQKYYNNRQINQVQGGTEQMWGDWTTDQTIAALYTNNQYRFVSNAKFDPQLPAGENHTTAFRTYFATDINYSNGGTLLKPKAAVDGHWIAMGGNGYTTENTFDVEHQTWKNTTMVTVKATVEGGDFYTVADGQDMLTKATAKTKIASDVFNDADVASKLTTLIEKVAAAYPGTTIHANLTADFTTPGASKVGIDNTVTINVTKDDNPLAKSVVTNSEATAAWTAAETAIETAKEKYKANYYKDGVVYYNARIQHFGDVETPWLAGGAYVTGDGSTIDKIYGVGTTDAEKLLRNKRFLGRYGVVRDNWYQLEVESINKIGTAEPIDVSTTTPDTPDDQIENYISVHVHIVPWVVRTQKVKF